MKERSSSIIKCILCIIKCMLSNVYYCCFCEIFNQFGANLVTDVKSETGLQLVMELEVPLHCAQHSIIVPQLTALYSVQYIYSVQCTLYSTMCSVQWRSRCTAQNTQSLRPSHYTVHTVYSTMCIVQCTMENNGEHSIIAP